jgi:hypothetical protein
MPMKKIATILSLMGAITLAQATLVADWNFNSQATGAAPTSITDDHGSGSLDLSHLSAGADATISSSGASQNEFGSDTAGNALLISSGTGENGKSIIFSLNMSSLQNLVLTYATEASTSGFTTQNWLYSTNGGTTFTPSAAITSIGTAYATETVNFSSALNNDPSILIELTLSGATSGNGTAHFDNLQFNATAVPEPAGCSLISAVGLLIICGTSTWRKRLTAK